MTVGFAESIGLHAQALILREKRGEILASNIANAATPGFKARDFDFESELARANGKGGMDRTSTTHLGGTLADGNLGFRVPVTASLDGNTVELGVEQMEFAENTVRYQSSLTFLNRRISGLMSAIKGE